MMNILCVHHRDGLFFVCCLMADFEFDHFDHDHFDHNKKSGSPLMERA